MNTPDMNTSDFKNDLPHYRWGLLTLLLVLGVGGTAIAISLSYLASAQKSQSAAQKHLSDARKELAAAQDDHVNMDTYAEEYERLLKRNIIGEEQRLDWIDGLEIIRKQNLVVEFKYAIAPQQTYKPPTAVDSGNFDLNMSEMKLSFSLLHEGQLVSFFNALRSNVKGQFILDGCTLNREDEAQANNLSSISPRIRAECKGEWLTLKNRNTP